MSVMKEEEEEDDDEKAEIFVGSETTHHKSVNCNSLGGHGSSSPSSSSWRRSGNSRHTRSVDLGDGHASPINERSTVCLFV